jgi:hypothetical protein
MVPGLARPPPAVARLVLTRTPFSPPDRSVRAAQLHGNGALRNLRDRRQRPVGWGTTRRELPGYRIRVVVERLAPAPVQGNIHRWR